jgi:LmbE family N-acetylglucosaminyl deacetylase
MVAGTTVEVLCLTHGQSWTLPGAPGDLAALRGAELASAADVLGPVRVKMQDCPDGCLGEVCQTKLAAAVVAAADSSHPEGLLVFDTPAVTGRLDHAAATGAGLLAAETLGLPVLGWDLPETVASQLNQETGASETGASETGPGETGASETGHQDDGIDLRVNIDRARRRVVSHADASETTPGSAQWRRLELLAESGSLRWLRPPRGGAGRLTTRARRTAKG